MTFAKVVNQNSQSPKISASSYILISELLRWAEGTRSWNCSFLSWGMNFRKISEKRISIRVDNNILEINTSIYNS